MAVDKNQGFEHLMLRSFVNSPSVAKHLKNLTMSAEK